MEVKTYYTEGDILIDQVEDILVENFGDTYKYKVNRKAKSIAGKIATGGAADHIVVIKNAYHRMVITLDKVKDPRTITGEANTIVFSEATVAGWLAFFNKEVGIIGHFIIRAIYGKANEFYTEVEKAVKDNIKGKEETINVGLSAIFKK
ncbi:hypothetical protein [Tenacibaculum jejuense]|uniref:Uncharacterized protein n=1 Tax=Tenacibaculum jejuense TaxID=584609 RepID=A0A238U759_9FLAO|nr:hypothetical protein [Tenacibaculum jejuense]SNR14210.1 conserved protein of unknown function [Tenacibaculum jejuense]